MSGNRSSELKILLVNTDIQEKEARERFYFNFRCQPDFCFFHGLYLSAGKEPDYLHKGHIHLFVHGELYEKDCLNALTDIYLKGNKPDEKVLASINGSFLILVIDEKEKTFSVMTDRVNSKKLFFYQDQQLYALFTDPGYLNSLDQEINIAGVASALINGVVYNNNTLYRRTKVLERACLHTFSFGIHVSRPYWKYEFTNEYAGIPRIELKRTLAKLLIESVQRRIYSINPGTCFLSLSGGYDSRFLLGALRSMKNGFRLKSFSYGMSNKLSLGDDAIARLLADKFNIEHRFEPAYTSGLLNTISQNATYGYGLSNFCSEIDAWLKLNEEFAEDSSALLFVGDMYYLPSYNFKFVKDKRILLLYSTVLSWQYLKPLMAVLPENNREQLVSSYQGLYQEITERMPQTDDFQVLKDFIYLDQRISHTLMYWRNFFHSPFITVTQPLLDNELLDFIRKLPNELRFNKILYKETVREMFPDLFEIPVAQNIWANPSWIDEIENNRDAIVNELNTTNSSLDPLIPPETIKMLINNDNKVKRIFQMSKAAGIARKLSRKNDLLNNLLGNIVINNTHVKRNQLIIRILMLRKSLQVK